MRKKYPKSAVCILKNKDGDILLLKRKKDDRTIPSIYCLPGGKSDINETIEQTLIREVYEETGITLSNYIYIKEVENIYFFQSYVTDINICLSNEHESYIITKEFNNIKIAPITLSVLKTII
jgi:8-oxo-dGTP diphosphatase